MAWYGAAWLNRIMLTFDHDYVDASGEYCVLVTNSVLPDSFFDHVKSDGTDIVVTTDDQVTKVDRDVVKLSIDDNILVLRFLATLSASADVDYYLYYGNSAGSESNSTGAYQSTLDMYIPCDEVETGAPATLYDRTENDNDMTAVSIIQDGDPAHIGYVITLDGANDYAHAADAASLDITNNLTVMLWNRGGGTPPGVDERLASKYKTSDGNRSWMMSTGAANAALLRVYISDDGSFDAGHRKDYTSSITGIEADTWHHVAFTFASGTLTIVIDGVEDESVTKTIDDAITTIYSGAASVVLAANGDFGEKWGVGYLDEFKVFSEALSVDQISTIFKNEDDTESFVVTSGVVISNVQLNIKKVNDVAVSRVDL
jgi:hypothetical protein